jgi:ATP phosphoribosyltransferase regulatory subunit
MTRQRLHTPEGVRDIYNEECEKKLVLESRINGRLRQYGYHPIQTPTFEFFDIFSQEIGTTPSRELYKFFDREGNTLVLRPDITPSIARSAAKYFSDEELPIRLCYMGNTFINNTSYQGRLKESTQLGAELIGDASEDADAEILSMAVECLRSTGLRDFQISVGHADFFQGLVEAAGISEEDEDELRELLLNKNFFGVSETVSALHLDNDLEKLFEMLGTLYSDPNELTQAKKYAAKYPRILSSLKRLDELHDILDMYGISDYVSFELGMISTFQYYTGIIFAGYTYGSGEAIVKGGRYDKLLSFFGKNSPSIGFALVVDQLMAAISRQHIAIETDHGTKLVVYDVTERKNAIEYARKERAQGSNIELVIYDNDKTEDYYREYAAQGAISEVIFMKRS